MYVRVLSVLLLAASLAPNPARDRSGAGPASPASQPPPLCQNLAFSQLDLDLDGHMSMDSDWGSLDLSFLHSDSILYFNLAVRNPRTLMETWQIRNVPVLSRESINACEALTFNFDLGVAPGTDVRELDYGFALTPDTLNMMPDVFLTAMVDDSPYAIDSGFRHHRIRIARAGPLVGGPVAAGEMGAWHDFPNQDCGKNECTPAAVSNSLTFLNAKNNLGIDPAELSILKMKIATRWQPAGTDQNGWFTFKANYLATNLATKGITITTKTINPTNPAAVEAAVRDGCDVELSTNSHTAALVGIVKQANGNYAMEVAHDTQQGQMGGTKVETTEFNPKTTKLSGGAWLANTKVKHFVVECGPMRT